MNYFSGYRGKKYRGFDFGNFEITKREVLASITIIAVLLLVGVLISSKISEHQMDKNEVYNKAVKLQSTEQFQYGMNTNAGSAFVYGDLEAVDTVNYPEVSGDYIRIVKTEEHYNMHTETYTTTDSNGHTQVHTRTYWSWDYAGEEEKHAKEISFLGITFDYGKIKLPSPSNIETIDGGYHIRYVYTGVSTKYTGTIFTNLKDKTILDKTPFYAGKTIDEAVESLESGKGVVIFWIIWIVVIGGCVFGFYYLKNDWLEG